jgi:type II secretory ATPase GspE/PulE/Tfp pilus assembly ATPase PilB-like protein
MSVIVAAAAESQLTDVLRRYETLKDAAAPRATAALAPGEAAAPHPHWSGERPEVVQLVDALIADAVRREATSLHVDPMCEGIQVRVRVDGVLMPLRAFTGTDAVGVASRLHLMAGTRDADGSALRQGRCRVRVDGREVELRFSSLAGLTGESITCRIVDPRRSEPGLDGMSLDPETLRRLRETVGRRHGLVLAAGPLGGGKTTLLHALLRELAAAGLQSAAVESDPETLLPGVHQLRVDVARSQSLAEAAEAALRQSPDVLMIDVLADAETAAVACRAAAGGRLVLAGVPAQGALDAVGRLLDMGVAPSLLATSLAAVFAQRLAPRVCEVCAEDAAPPAPALRALAAYCPGTPARTRRGRGCAECFGRGARGRVGVHELLSVDADLRYLIAERRPPSAILEHVARHGFRSMLVDTAAKTLHGLIPAEEAPGLPPLAAA